MRQRIEGRGLALVFEPGRSIVANAGLLLTRVEYLKHTAHKDFAIVDAAMNDLIRPALYRPDERGRGAAARRRYAPLRHRRADLRDRRLPRQGSRAGTGRRRPACGVFGRRLWLRNELQLHNTRGRAAEVLVDGDQAFEVRRRESVQELYAGESLLPAEATIMLLRFTKMHGHGQRLHGHRPVSQHAHIQPKHAKQWGDRHTGVGFDQLLIVEPPQNPDVDFRYRIFNSDGSEVEQCGNARAASPASWSTSA